jgi:hypothetical protein
LVSRRKFLVEPRANDPEGFEGSPYVRVGGVEHCGVIVGCAVRVDVISREWKAIVGNGKVFVDPEVNVDFEISHIDHPVRSAEDTPKDSSRLYTYHRRSRGTNNRCIDFESGV